MTNIATRGFQIVNEWQYVEIIFSAFQVRLTHPNKEIVTLSQSPYGKLMVTQW